MYVGITLGLSFKRIDLAYEKANNSRIIATSYFGDQMLLIEVFRDIETKLYLPPLLII
jgi:hypothetical protein